MRLRIGLVTSEFPPDRGGVETYAWQLAKALGRRPSLQVTVYAPHKSASIAAPPGVTIKPILTSCMGLDWPKPEREAGRRLACPVCGPRMDRRERRAHGSFSAWQ